ncbi:MAG: TIM barrel protein [Pseudomonadota bacterium]
MRFSANLGFLWAELPLPEAIRAAHAHGFDAVECHWPFDQDPHSVREALAETGLTMLGLNTSRGDTILGEFGLSALPGRQSDAGQAIDQAIHYADQIDAQAIHVMAGIADGPKAHAIFIENLVYACDQTDRTILIEPINIYDVPGYFLNSLAQAEAILTDLNRPNLKLMFDCYHVARTEGDVFAHLQRLLPMIGHIQIASIPDRRAPDQGILDYSSVFDLLDRLGWDRPIGAEYKPDGPTEQSLEWLTAARR